MCRFGGRAYLNHFYAVQGLKNKENNRVNSKTIALHESTNTPPAVKLRSKKGKTAALTTHRNQWFVLSLGLFALPREFTNPLQSLYAM